MAGHAYPVFLRFKGGKAVASFIGAFLYLTPLPLSAVLVLFVHRRAATRHISAGSVIAAGMFPLGVWLILHPPAPVLMASLIAGVFIVVRHRSNMERLHAGNENVFSLEQDDEAGDPRRRELGHRARHRAGAEIFDRSACGCYEADLAARMRECRGRTTYFLPGFKLPPTST